MPSLPGHGYWRLTEMLDKQLVGDDEQYAVAMALMLAKIGVPARVVMGFRPAAADPATEIAVTGKDVRAWVEVPFDGFGWVAFDPHPTNRKPRQADAGPARSPVLRGAAAAAAAAGAGRAAAAAAGRRDRRREIAARTWPGCG